MTKTREELFEEAKRKRKEEKERNNNNNYEGGQYEEVVYTSLSEKVDKVIRITGNPLNSRVNATDPKMSLMSMILGDNNKKFRCIWPDKNDDPNWILWQIYDKIMSYTWDSVNNEKKFHYISSHSDLFRRVQKNNSENRFEQGWKPNKFVQMNIIDRHDMSWHRENKHYKILSKKASENGENIWFEPGVPEYLYNVIWDDIVEYNGNWEGYDVVIRKLTEKPYYNAFHSIDDLKKIQTDAKQYIVEGDLTEEESMWEGYDLDKLFPVTSYTKIKNRLGKFIKKFDLDFNSNLSEELEYNVLLEEKERKLQDTRKSTAVVEKNNIEESDLDLDLDIEEEPKEKIKTRSRVKNDSIPWEKLSDGSYNETVYEGVSQMTEEEKSLVVSINEDGTFEYKEGNYDLLRNPSSDFISPESYHIDPLSGELF